MSGKRYTEEFKIEAIHQVTDRGYKIGEVSERLGVTSKSLRGWITKYGDTGSQHQMISGQQSLRGYKRHRGFKSGGISHVAPTVTLLQTRGSSVPGPRPQPILGHRLHVHPHP